MGGGLYVFILVGGCGRGHRGGAKKCYDSIVYIETPAVHIDCNMIYVK